LVERLVIADVGHRGDGIVNGGEGPVYVSYTLPGEIVEVDPWPGHPDRRDLLRVTAPSPERIEPICPHFGVCGGCAVQHWRGERYRTWKRNLVTAALAEAGIAAQVGELIDAHGEGRRRCVLHARRGTHDILQVGFAAAHTHRIVAIDRCPILAPELNGIIDAAWAIAEALRDAAKPLDIQATATEAGIDVDVRGSGPLSADVAAALAGIAETHRLARITRHGELVAQRIAPIIRIARATVALPPGAFLQATACGEETLARLVLANVGSAKSVADLFCGVGPFALRLAERANVLAADSNDAAVAALRRAAAAAQGLKPVEAVRRDLFRRPLAATELSRLDVVVFDPPRQGAEAQARELAKSSVPKIVGVSCNIPTFVRDAKILLAGGYRLSAVTPIDQFRYSPHVELVGTFGR
jgi:23S rRNA (uracil1939-C5)-methyltransferase